jgi:protein-S-isoprenylcysteine O-methyltransferase Ste14
MGGGRMSIIPAFEIGLWNAWILILFDNLTTIVPSLVIGKAVNKMMVWPPYNRIEKILALSTHFVIAPVCIVYSIFLPLRLGTAWFYVGLPIYFLSIVVKLIATISIATTPLDEPVTKGVYRISRHPAYLSGFLLYIGIGIACASWIFLLCGVLWITLWHIMLPVEERFCIEKYGDPYREYMNRTPRWIGIPKSEKK